MSALALASVATCNLCQWAMEFEVNLLNVCKSIDIAKRRGCTLRTGPELELTGYGCEDHFYESDTLLHAWESLARIIDSDLTEGILCDIGMPLMHDGVRYNCRVFVLNRQIVLIRPKMDLADDGNYRESRWFTAWPRLAPMGRCRVHPVVSAVNGQTYAPIGAALLELNDACVAAETCEELFTPDSPHILQALNGAEIFLNGSGSHHNLRKLQKRLDLIRNATDKSGGVYLYANQQGCDGGRLYYDGCALVACNGDLLAQGSQFSVHDVEVVCAVVDLESVRSFRAATVSRNIQAARARRLPRVRVDFALCKPALQLSAPTPSMTHARIHCAEEEIAYGPACWLWDFLRRSGAGGFFLPLSGGADSAATATIVGVMCQLVVRGCATGDSQVISDARRVAGAGPSEVNYVPTDAREFCRRVFHTCYMGTQNSTAETRARAAALANDIGSYHMDTDIDSIVAGFMTVVQALLGKAPRFKVYGGSETENLALQNIQARSRMVLSYLLAQLLPWARGTRGYLLVLGSANVDEALRGYLTKYDCSSADINPIGGISKEDLKSFMSWAARACNMPSLLQIVEAKASAELEPQTEQHKQVSEEDMGLTFAELGVFGRLRKMARSGPVSMFQRVRHVWTHLSPSAVADKVKRFFTFYASNRHKVTTLTPSYHAENYSPEDNRYDHRQFLYHTKWPRQFAAIDRLVPLMEAQDKQAAARAQHSTSADTLVAVTASGSGVTRRAAL